MKVIIALLALIAFATADTCGQTYTVQSGDICYNIAANNGLSLDDFYNLNPGIDCSDLQIGQVVCVSAGSGPNPGPTPPTPSGTITFDQFTQAVNINGYPAPTQDQYNSFINNYQSAGGITNNMELAMFLSEIMWESGGLQYKVEIACEVTQCPDEYRSPGDAPNLFYYGRGYIQLSWSYNYAAASEALFGDDRLVTDPDQVATNEDIAWQTAFWFWKANVGSNPGVEAGQFGSATDCINGALECNPCNEQCQGRNAIYAHVLSIFDPSEQPNYAGC